MRIAEIEVFELKLDAPSPYLGTAPTTAPGYFVREPWRSIYSQRFETVLVRLVADDGTEGWGEALAPVAPEIVGTIIRTLLAPVLIGRDASSPRATYLFLRSLMRERGHLVGHQADAVAALDIALWDLAGRLTGLPVATMLGGAVRDSIPVYVSGLPRDDDGGRAELAAEWAAKGVDSFKLHLGHGVARDLATFDAVRAEVPDARIAVDAHWAYSVTEAAALATALEERGAWFLEAPLAPEHVAGHADLSRRTSVPIAIGESLRSRYEFGAWLEAGALGIAQPDVARTGITEAMIIADLCTVHEVPVGPHHSTGLGVSLAAGLHVSAAVESLLAFEYQPTSAAVSALNLGTDFRQTAATIPLPPGPGLGVDIDVTTVRRLHEES